MASFESALGALRIGFVYLLATPSRRQQVVVAREVFGWRRRIAAWRSRRAVFVYLNNDWKGYAPANARYLKRGLSTGGEG